MPSLSPALWNMERNPFAALSPIVSHLARDVGTKKSKKIIDTLLFNMRFFIVCHDGRKKEEAKTVDRKQKN